MKKEKQGEKRPTRHDELVAELLNDLDSLICVTPLEALVTDISYDGGKTWEVNKPGVEVERKSGYGYIDLCLRWSISCGALCESPEWEDHEGKVHPATKSFCDRVLKRGIIVEVKTELEQWSAGDVIRQLKGYQLQEEYESMCPYHQDYGRFWKDIPPRTCPGPPRLNKALRYSLVLYSGRDLSAAERQLFEHESVICFTSKEFKGV